MDEKKRNEEVDKTFEAYRELAPVQVSDRFFEGVLRKVRLADETDRPVSWLKLSLASAALAAILVINVLTMVMAYRDGEAVSVTREQAMMTLVNEYAIQTKMIDYDTGTGGL